jgi:hypothetical protein
MNWAFGGNSTTGRTAAIKAELNTLPISDVEQSKDG